jgi:hypothetical protein
MLDVAVALGRFRARRGIGHEGGEALELGLETPHLVEAGERFREHGARLARSDFLGQIADGDSTVTMHAPAIGILDPREDTAERGLARAVGAAQADPLAAADAPRDVTEEDLPAVSLGDCVESDHGAGRLSHGLHAVGRDGIGHAHFLGLAVRVAVLAEVFLGERIDVRVGTRLGDRGYLGP